MQAKRFDRDFLLQCADEVLSWIGLQDPMFADRIDITRTEYHLDSLQILALYCAGILDRGEHMFISEREFMRPDYSGHLGPRECVVCDKPFTPGTATAEMCGSKDCAQAYYAAIDAQHVEKDA